MQNNFFSLKKQKCLGEVQSHPYLVAQSNPRASAHDAVTVDDVPDSLLLFRGQNVSLEWYDQIVYLI